MADIITYVRLNRDDISKIIPYMLIAETTSRSIWSTGTRKRRWSQAFSKHEREQFNKLIRQSHLWAFRTGIPDTLQIRSSTILQWQKLAEFCMQF